MKKKVLIAFLIVGIIIGGVLNALEDDTSPKGTQELASTSPSPETTIVTAPETTESTLELSDAERLGVSEKELGVIEHVMSVAGWDFARDDFERIYRLKDSEMVLNPATFVEYDVSIFDGETHRITVNKDLVE